MIMLPADHNLAQAIEVFGSGIHRIIVTDAASRVVGVLNQLQLLEFFWNERISFPVIDHLCHVTLRDLHIGSQQIIAIK